MFQQKLNKEELQDAAINSHIEAIKFLTSILPDGDVKFINVPNCQGKTPLELAKMNGNTEIINFFTKFEKIRKKRNLKYTARMKLKFLTKYFVE